jgi:hypothetical protein
MIALQPEVVMNRIQEVKKAFPEYAGLALEIADPTHKNKYLMWIASQLAKKYSKEDVRSTVSAFHKDSKRLRESDIYQYKDLKALENEIKDLELSKRQVEIFSKEMGAVKVFGDDTCTLVRINSKTAMLYYGKASRWCIAMEDEEYWEDYSAGGNIFYVLLDKVAHRKFAIQKKGLMDVTIWEENDDEVDDIDDWVKRNRKFEDAVFACLHDREDPMLHKIKTRTTTRAEVLAWLKYQHKSTIKYIEHDLRGAGYYLFDTDAPITNKSINHLTHLRIEDIKNIQAEAPKCIDEVVKYLAEHPKIKVKGLRMKLGRIIPNPEIILSEEDANFIRMQTDPSIATKLLNSSKSEIWLKALPQAQPEVILSLLPTVSKAKKAAFTRRLKMMTHYDHLVEWLSNLNTVLPEHVWRKQSGSQYGYADDDDEVLEEEE